MQMWMFVLILFSFSSLLGVGRSGHPRQHPEEQSEHLPWFTGPLLTPSGHVVPAGYVNFEPYFFYTINDGLYTSDWSSISTPNVTTTNFQGFLWFGLTPWADIEIVPRATWVETEGVSNLQLGDFTVALEFQLWLDTPHNNIPGVKFYIQQLFPTGPYDERSLGKLGTDIGGDGTFATQLGFVLTRTFHLGSVHYLALRLNPFFTLSSKVDVKGFSTYGGAPNTRATVKPGTNWGAFFGLEYSITKNWAFALDLFGNVANETKFSGNPGTLPDGSPAPLGAPFNVQLSVAPALEYNFSESLGIIAGPWLTFAGKNAPRFKSFVFAVNYFGPIKRRSRN